ncbi:M23 family metallopeptidase [Streptomyces cavernicola]|uniref:M23 family metallopeptidase n=1 Tax=Streptomyces cavernicola TaxID=3043613 RepID=A0ABT6S7X4_9ACTN|nr:M23 family metallopeptidase [Streptomyces sp. B-S-A6]MDI3404188.1 M23 family metallopeptidase [Streptomyces sp. B-S-A6]
MAVLLGGVLAAAALSAPTAAAQDPLADRPDFKAPYQCKEKGWTYFGGHDYTGALDINKGSGNSDLGEPILASAGGKVNVATDSKAGKYVEIDHGGGWQTRYLHLQSQTVKDGAKVQQGDRIGTLGNTGDAPLAHLHFDQRLNGKGVEVHLEGKNLYPYPPNDSERKELVSSNCGGDGDDPGEPGPEPKATTLEYTGDKSISNGSDAKLSAVLKTKKSEKPVKNRVVSFKLGTGESAETCKDKTDAKGKASCPVPVTGQKLTDDAEVPLTATFKGDSSYGKSKDNADLKLQHVEGRSYGLSAEVPLPLVPVNIDPTPDTGPVRAAGAETEGPECVKGVDALVLDVKALCAKVATRTGPSSATSTATVADANIGLPGLPVIGVSGLTSKSTSSCTKSKGSVSLELTVAGKAVELPSTPGFEVDLGPAGKLVVNEQTRVKGADKGLTVNAVHLTTLGGADVVLGSSTSSAHNCK